MAPEPLRPHETPQFQNAVEHVVAVAFRVAGGERREAVGCANTHRVGLPGDRRACECVYCRPDDHLATRELAASGAHWFSGPCIHHRHVQIVVIDGDPEGLQRLADVSLRGEP